MRKVCYLWNETHGAKGSCEVASAVFSYLRDLKKADINTAHLFCDRCVGQNSNRIVFIMLSYALITLGFSDICLNFLVTGHSQNLNDNTHALIEKQARNAQIFTTAQYETLIYQSFTSDSVTVAMPCFDKVIDFKKFANECPHYSHLMKGSTYDANNEKIQWTKIMQLKFSDEHSHKSFFKYQYSAQQFNEVSFLKVNRKSSRRQSSEFELPAVSELPSLYASRLSVTKNKKVDLLKLCKTMLIPPHHHSFL